MKKPVTILLAVVLFFFSAGVFANDYYVITGTYETQQEAQQIAALKGGWVLHTSFYHQLTANLFAVVRGPFRTKQAADKQLAWLMRGKNYPGSYVKNAGAINIQLKIGNRTVSPHMLALLLGEIRIDVTDQKGAANPCEPQEPYRDISLSYVTVAREYDDKKGEVTFKPQDVALDVGAFREISGTGVLEHMRICAE